MVAKIVIDDAGADRHWLVMVHGMSQDHRVFDAQVEEFRKAYRLLLIDLPGHGMSSDHPGPYGHVEVAQHIREAIRQGDIARTHFWATHTGAAAGLLMACAEPGLFQSLILEGPVMPGQNVAVVISELARVSAIAKSQGVSAAVESWWLKACWFDYMRAHPIECRAEQHHAIVSEFGARPWMDPGAVEPVLDVSKQLPQLMVPTLLYNGDSDHPDFLTEAERLAELLPNARRITIVDAGGFPAWERPVHVNQCIAEFLAELDHRA